MSEKSADTTGAVSSDAFEFSDTDALDAMFGVFSDSRRRELLRCLAAYDAPMALADLADEVAVAEQGVPITEISPEEVKHVYVSLYHTHVPKLEDAGVVRYDQERDLVALAPDRQVPDWFDALRSSSDGVDGT